MIDGQIIEEEDEESEKSDSDDDLDGIGDVVDENEAQNGAKAKKKKYKTFRTKEVEQKTQDPAWEYSGSHILDIDEDILLKFQSESLAVAVYGMQDGREKFGKVLKNAFDKGQKDKLGGTGKLSLSEKESNDIVIPDA